MYKIFIKTCSHWKNKTMISHGKESTNMLYKTGEAYRDEENKLEETKKYDLVMLVF